MSKIKRFAASLDEEYRELMAFLWGEAPPVAAPQQQQEPRPMDYRPQYDNISYRMPVEGPLVSRHLPGAQHATPTHPQGHTGIDIGGTRGTPIYSIAPGYVSDVGYGSRKGGNWVITRHESGGQVKAYYAHLDSIDVRKGQQVDQNTIIGRMGDSGNAKGRSVHLHFQVSVNNNPIDPLALSGRQVGSIVRERIAYIEHAAEIYKSALRLTEAFSQEDIESMKRDLIGFVNNQYQDKKEAIEDIRNVFSARNLRLTGPIAEKAMGTNVDKFYIWTEEFDIVHPAYVAVEWRENDDRTLSFSAFLNEGYPMEMDKPSLDRSDFED